MSLATRQTLTLLAVVNGSLFLISNIETIPEDVAPTVLWAKDFCKELMQHYPETGNKRKNTLQMKAWLPQWDRIGADKMLRWHPSVVATLALNFCEDLLEKIHNRARSDIKTLRDALIRISYFFSEADYNEEHFEEANQMTEEIYSVIGFSR